MAQGVEEENPTSTMESARDPIPRDSARDHTLPSGNADDALRTEPSGPPSMAERPPRGVLSKDEDDERATRATVEQQEHASNVRRMRFMLSIGTVLWALIGFLDWTIVKYVDPGSLAYFRVLRGGEMVLLVLVIALLSRKKTPSRAAFTALDLGTFVGASVGLSLMCLHYRGISSPYAHGISCVLVARGIAVSERWKRGLVMMGLPAIAFPVTILGAARFAPHIDAQLHDPAQLTMFVHNVALVVVTCVLLVAGGNESWKLRRRVYEARSVGRYRLKERIGVGGMGEVWRAWHPALHREIAVKILKPTETSNAQIARFEREVRATTELQHPNTVRVFDFGVTDDGLWYYAMELLEGQTLADLAKSGGLEPMRAVHIVRQACRAIAEAHGRGIVHRDVKPENLFVTSLGGEKDFVKVLDFGIAKLRDGDGNDTLTREGALIGTPMFMAPEQATGRTVDARSDVYSLGAVLSYALTGKPPFEGPNATAILLRHVSAPPSAPSESARHPISQALDAVVLRCLEKDPSKRYASAAELDHALEECVRG